MKLDWRAGAAALVVVLIAVAVIVKVATATPPNVPTAHVEAGSDPVSHASEESEGVDALKHRQ